MKAVLISNAVKPKFMPDPVVAALAKVGAPWPAIAAAAADAKLGTATLVLEVGDAIAVTDHFVITNGNNSRQVKAIVDEVEHQVKLVGGPKPVRVEGLESLDWVLIDYGEFVVHVFSPEARGYYQLERLWKDCPQLDWRAQVPAELQARVGGGGGEPASPAVVAPVAEPLPEPVPVEPAAEFEVDAADAPVDTGPEEAGPADTDTEDTGPDEAGPADTDTDADPIVERATW